MLKTPRLILLLVALAAVLVASGCGDDGGVPSDSVAKVGDAKITKSQFDHWFTAAVKQQAQSTGQSPADVKVPKPPDFAECVAAKQKQPVPKGVPKPDPKALKDQCKTEYEGLRNQTLQFLISSQWLTQEAKKRKIVASDKEVQTTFEQQKKQSFPKEKDYQKFLETSGQSETDLLYRVRLSVLTNKLQQSIVKDKGTVSQAAIKDYYEKNKQRFAQPETRDLLVVLTKNKGQADAAKKDIDSGTPWARVAKKYSTDDASKSQGGKLPGVTKGQQEKTFDAAIFSAQKGKVLGPIKTQFGFYVFRVTKVTPAKQQTLEQVSTTIKNLLQSQQQQKALNDFVKDFQDRYRKLTECAKGYVVDQCDNAPKKGTNTTPVSGAPPQQAPTPTPVPPQGGAVPPGAQQVPPQGAPPQGAPPQQAPPQGAPPAP